MSHRAKKSLGQHFLKSQMIVRTIVDTAHINDRDIILEIGPGKGILTEHLLRAAKKVIAIEKDRDLVAHLKEKFEKEIQIGKLDVIEKDILELNPVDYPLLLSPYKLVANIPYYITGAIIKKFLENPHQPKQMVLLVQKEVAQRIVARDGKESILSISVKAYGVPRYIKKVPALFFSPSPKVDSAILLIENISKDFFNTFSEKEFFSLLKKGFAHKRKLLISNFQEITSKKELLSLFQKCTLSEKIRAEDITLEEWACLAQKMVTIDQDRFQT